MRLAIFENQFMNIKSSFDALNLIHFNNDAEFKVFETSQDVSDYNSLSEYDFILVDLDLSAKSKLDGYDIILKLHELNIPKNKIFIITGHKFIDNKLKEKGLLGTSIIQKPIELSKLEKSFSLKT